MDAVRQWVYEPFLVNGKPREICLTTTVVFELDEEEGEAKVGGILGGVVGGVIGKEEVAKLMQLPPVKIEGGLQEPQKLKSVDPVYPQEAKNARIQGEVMLEVETGFSGRVMYIKVLRSIPALDQAAMDAVRQWVYQPLIVDGKPRRAIFPVTVNFVLNESFFYF